MLNTIFKDQINPERVRHCMNAAEYVYEKKPKAALRKVGLELVELFDINGTQALIAATDEAYYIPVRGTDELGDVATDLKFVKTDFSGGGRVHTGFHDYYKQIEEPMARVLETLDDRPRIFTGHSLGASALMAGIIFNGAAGYFFGSPRLGNEAFVETVTFPVWRFEHWSDPVTYVPPRIPLWGAVWALGHGRMPTWYDHAGTAIHLDGDLHRMVHYRKSVTKFLEELEHGKEPEA